MRIVNRVFMILLLFASVITPPSLAEPETASILTGPPNISNSPLIELPVEKSDSDMMAVILSGDGGWADLDKVFGEAFQERGMATVGFDCLKYFWEPRQPAEVTRDLDAIIRYYLQTWGKKRVLLVGYSFGACWLPFLVNRLPHDLLRQVPLVVLLAPGSFANIEVHIKDWMGDERREGALDVLPETLQIKKPVLCVAGVEDDSSICSLLSGNNAKKLITAGGHHFNHEYDKVINTIFSTLHEESSSK